MTAPDFHFKVEPDLVKGRLDVFLAEKLPQFSRSQIQKWIKDGHILLNGKKTIPAVKFSEGEKIDVTIPPEEVSVVPEDMPLKVIFEDDRILVINKPIGQVTHPAHGNFTGTLANAAAHHLRIKKGSSKAKTGGLRPGIVHRLDKGTSGVLILAKDRKTQALLSKQFEEREVEKVYRAVVIGKMTDKQGEIVGSIGKDFDNLKMVVIPSGRYAKTDFKVLKKFSHHTYLEAYPKTGRTHQIRVHLAKINHPVLGDPLYYATQNTYAARTPETAPIRPGQRMMLHAYRLTVTHPTTKKRVTFEAPIPKDFQAVLNRLK